MCSLLWTPRRCFKSCHIHNDHTHVAYKCLPFLIRDFSVSKVYAGIKFHDIRNVIYFARNRLLISHCPSKNSQWYTTKYHSVSLCITGPFNDVSMTLSGTLSGNLKYRSITMNDTMNPKYHQNTIHIPFKYPWP